MQRKPKIITNVLSSFEKVNLMKIYNVKKHFLLKINIFIFSYFIINAREGNIFLQTFLFTRNVLLLRRWNLTKYLFCVNVNYFSAGYFRFIISEKLSESQKLNLFGKRPHIDKKSFLPSLILIRGRFILQEFNCIL